MWPFLFHPAHTVRDGSKRDVVCIRNSILCTAVQNLCPMFYQTLPEPPPPPFRLLTWKGYILLLNLNLVCFRRHVFIKYSWLCFMMLIWFTFWCKISTLFEKVTNTVKISLRVHHMNSEFMNKMYNHFCIWQLDVNKDRYVQRRATL